MSTRRGGTYNTGISEADVESKAHEDGQAGSLDQANVGVNSHVHAADHLVEGHEAAASTIGHDMRDDVQVVDAELDHLGEHVDQTAADALESIDNHKSAARHALVQDEKMRASDTTLPSSGRTSKYIALLLLLFFGELALVAVAFQVMGLADKPWVPGLVFTDDLHLAALSIVVGLVILAHLVGHHARRLEHALQTRRHAGPKGNGHPKPALSDYLCVGVGLVVAIAGTIALSAIRASYLRAIGAEAHQAAFTVVQLVLFAAAVALAFAHANPEVDRYNQVQKTLADATTERDAKVDAHVKIVGKHNSLIDLRVATLAMAGHHVDANAANVRGQISAYKRRYILDQHEPVREQLFAEHLTPTEYEDGELLKRLTGIAPLPVFTKGATKAVFDALAAERAELSTLQARIDQLAIDKLDLPDVSDTFLGQYDANPPEDTDNDNEASENDTATPATDAATPEVENEAGSDADAEETTPAQPGPSETDAEEVEPALHTVRTMSDPTDDDDGRQDGLHDQRRTA